MVHVFTSPNLDLFGFFTLNVGWYSILVTVHWFRLALRSVLLDLFHSPKGVIERFIDHTQPIMTEYLTKPWCITPPPPPPSIDRSTYLSVYLFIYFSVSSVFLCISLCPVWPADTWWTFPNIRNGCFLFLLVHAESHYTCECLNCLKQVSWLVPTALVTWRMLRSPSLLAQSVPSSPPPSSVSFT